MFSNAMLIDEYPRFLVALCIWREARGTSLEAKRGVAWVIMNRVRDTAKRWPGNVADTILQPYQFSSFNRDDPNASKLPKWSDSSWKECCTVAENVGEDPTGGATNYHSLEPGQQWPAWAIPEKLTKVIGPFKFYKL